MGIAEHSKAWTGGDGRKLDLGATTVDAWVFSDSSPTEADTTADDASASKPALKTAGSMLGAASREEDADPAAL
jgi:hypothetical protein